jgi:hypothetical protein
MPTFLQNSLEALERGYRQMYGASGGILVVPIPVSHNPEVGQWDQNMGGADPSAPVSPENTLANVNLMSPVRPSMATSANLPTFNASGKSDSSGSGGSGGQQSNPLQQFFQSLGGGGGGGGYDPVSGYTFGPSPGAGQSGYIIGAPLGGTDISKDPAMGQPLNNQDDTMVIDPNRGTPAARVNPQYYYTPTTREDQPDQPQRPLPPQFSDPRSGAPVPSSMGYGHAQAPPVQPASNVPAQPVGLVPGQNATPINVEPFSVVPRVDPNRVVEGPSGPEGQVTPAQQTQGTNTAVARHPMAARVAQIPRSEWGPAPRAQFVAPPAGYGAAPRAQLVTGNQGQVAQQPQQQGFNPFGWIGDLFNRAVQLVHSGRAGGGAALQQAHAQKAQQTAAQQPAPNYLPEVSTGLPGYNTIGGGNEGTASNQPSRGGMPMVVGAGANPAVGAPRGGTDISKNPEVGQFDLSSIMGGMGGGGGGGGGLSGSQASSLGSGISGLISSFYKNVPNFQFSNPNVGQVSPAYFTAPSLSPNTGGVLPYTV